MADVKALAEGLVALTVKEVQELADFLKSEYGIEPAAAAVVMAAGSGEGAAAKEEKKAIKLGESFYKIVGNKIFKKEYQIVEYYYAQK